MPSTLSMITGLIFSGGIFAAGGYLAANVTHSSTAGDATAVDQKQLTRPGTAGGAQRTLSDAISSEEQKSDAKAEKPATADATQHLSVTVNGIRNENGKILILVFDDPQAYAAYDFQNAAGYAEITASTGSVSFTFPELTKGPYAVGILHDENGNYDLDYDGGIPTEGYGTSGAAGPYDDPSFKQAGVLPGKVQIQLHYLK